MTVAELRDWLRSWVSKATGLPADQIGDDRPMDEFGLASRDAVTLARRHRGPHRRGAHRDRRHNHPTIAMLAKRIIEGDPDRARATTTGSGSVRRDAADDIAIVGFATRFPGAGRTPESTWEALAAGRSGITDLPGDRWAEFKQDEAGQDHRRGQRTGRLPRRREGVRRRLLPDEPARGQDGRPAAAAGTGVELGGARHAHILPATSKGTDVGVFLGTSTNDYQMLATMGLGDGASDTAAYALTGTSTSIIANRVSYYFDFRGPSVALDTTCSSSLVAVHQAVRSLRNGESTIALAGGVNMILTPAASLGFDSIGMIAASGKIKTFSADADGIGRAEGGSVVRPQTCCRRPPRR